MKDQKDFAVTFPGVQIIYQRILGKEVGLHQHDEHEFFFLLQGEVHLHVENKTLKAGPGKIVYLPPRTAHSFHANTSTKGERLILIIENEIWKKNNGIQTGPRVMSASQLCKEILFQLLINAKTKAATALIQTLVQTLSEMLEVQVMTGPGTQAKLSTRPIDQRIKNALLFIEENFAANLKLETIAKESGLSTRNLNRLFLKEVGMSPKQAMTYYRIQEAQKILATGKRSITDTALDVGYNSLSQFIATFRKHTGQIPSAFLPL